MQVINWPDQRPTNPAPAAVTLGKFDGVHLGHRAVLDQLIAESRARSLVSTVVTFDRNPLAIFAPEKVPTPLISEAKKTEIFASLGVEQQVVLRFDADFAATDPESFVSNVLTRGLNAKLVLASSGLRFGAKAAGDLALLRQLGASQGFEVIEVPQVNQGGRELSSSGIRDAVFRGDVGLAAGLLGRPYELTGTVVPGARRGREIGFPTANIEPGANPTVVPADGVYAGSFEILDGGQRQPPYRAAISIGTNPTFADAGGVRQIEAHLLDFDGDLYGRQVAVVFSQRLRDTVAFGSVAELVRQIELDVAATRELNL